MPTRPDPYEQDLDKNPANYAPLTPLSFLERAASVYPDRVAVIHGGLRQTWLESYKRAKRLASALAKRGIRRGDTVAAMLPNIPAMVEAHFGVPMSGAVLNTLNTRLDADAIAFMLEHGGAKILLTDREFSGTVEKIKTKIEIIDVEDPEFTGGKRLGKLTYVSAHGLDRARELAGESHAKARAALTDAGELRSGELEDIADFIHTRTS